MPREVPEAAAEAVVVEAPDALVPASPLVPLQLIEKARDFAAASLSARTRHLYRRSFDAFVAWCDERNLPALPATPGAVMLYLSWRADSGRKVPTIEVDLAAICEAHRAVGFLSPREHPRVREVLRGIRRTVGVAPKEKAPAAVPELKAMLATLGEGLAGLRDRALLLVGFTGALRRSELVSLDVADVEPTEEGAVVLLRRSKTDQEGEGQKVALPFASSPELCAVRSLQAWLEASGISEGAIFRSVNRHGQVRARLDGHAVALIVKRAALKAGLDAGAFSGHSLRAGFVTAAAREGRLERKIMDQTRHKSVVMVRRYIREADIFRENAAKGLL